MFVKTTEIKPKKTIEEMTDDELDEEFKNLEKYIRNNK
jgi:hypothetical protein